MKRASVLVGVAAAISVGCPSSDRAQNPPLASPTSAIALSAGALIVQAPARASGALHVGIDRSVFLDVTAIGASAVGAHVRPDGAIEYEDAFEATSLVHVASAGRTEEIRHVSHPNGASVVRHSVKLGPGLARLRVVDDYVEALDARGVARLRTEPAFVLDARGTRRAMRPTLARDGDAWSIAFSFDDRGLSYPLDVDPAWTVTTSLAKARRDESLHLVSGGKVVALGGLGTTGAPLSSVETWDPATGSWTSGGSLATPRAYHSSIALSNGKIVLVAGWGGATNPNTSSSAEVFDPTTGTSTPIAALSPQPVLYFPSLAAVSATRVVVIGSGMSALLDVAAGTWTSTPTNVGRQYATARALASGKVLLAGGAALDAAGTALSSAEIFDPATSAWTNVAPMKGARVKPESQLLASGKLLVAGGQGISSAELYDPVANTWTSTPPMTSQHAYGGSVVLPGGRVLMVAGDIDGGTTAATDLYDPSSNTWVFAGNIASPRDDFGLTLLASGKVMIAGGNNGAPVPIVEIFDPLPNGRACLGPGECTSGNCVEGVCCVAPSCASGLTCAGSGAPGTCLAADGSKCTTDAECGSAHCVDGVCCESACTDTCAACDVKGSEGKCVPVAAGDDPHGGRAACAGSGVCRARCGGVDAKTCTQFPGTAISCAPPSCANGQESRPSGCDGAGGCVPPATRACAPYVCGATQCKTDCSADDDCAAGNSCDLVSRKCVVAATCDGDHTVTSPDGNQKDCTPFRCGGARCLDTCADSSACANGFLCDTASSRCVPPAGDAAANSGGGCAFGNAEACSGGAWITAMILAARRRKRR